MSRFLAVFLLALSTAALHAQGVLSDCLVIIHVRTEDRDFSGRAQIEIDSTMGTPITTLQTNADGTASTTVKSGATYRVKITGPEIEPASYEFFIFGGNTSQTENFNVKFRTGTTQTTSSQTVSVAEMNAPPNAREEMKKGMEAFEKGDMSKAQQRFEKAIAIYPQYARAYANLGIIAAKSGDRAKARSLFTKATEVDDKFLPSYVNLARLDVQEKNYKQAEATLDKVIALNPAMTEAVAMLATAEYGSKDYDKALTDAQRVHMLGHDEQFANMHLMAGQILEMQNRGLEAVAEYKMFLKEDPHSPQAKAVQRAMADLEAKR